MLGEQATVGSGLSGNQLAMYERGTRFDAKNGPQKQMFFLSLNSKIKENKNASEIIKAVNMLVSSVNSEYLWEYMTRRFCTSLR